MDVKDAQRDWDAFGKADPLWAILTAPGKRGKWQAAEFFETGVREVEALMQYIDSLGLHPARRKALDFGCGVGRLSQALTAYFEEVHGVDVAPSMIEQANHYNRHGSRCVYHVNDRPSLELFTDSTFDLVYSVITLQHLEPKDSARYIQEFVRVLAPGGLAVFQLPDRPAKPIRALVKRRLAKGLLQFSRVAGYLKRPIMVMHGIEREEVLRLLERSGAKVVDVREDQSAGHDWTGYRYCTVRL